MATNNDRIIFQHGEDQLISEKEFEHSQTPYEQTERLKHRLIFWTATATKELEQYVGIIATTTITAFVRKGF